VQHRAVQQLGLSPTPTSRINLLLSHRRGSTAQHSTAQVCQADAAFMGEECDKTELEDSTEQLEDSTAQLEDSMAQHSTAPHTHEVGRRRMLILK
jgi:hypothetical protein